MFSMILAIANILYGQDDVKTIVAKGDRVQRPATWVTVSGQAAQQIQLASGSGLYFESTHQMIEFIGQAGQFLGT